MADITITIPNGVLTRVLDAIAASEGYNPATDGTKAQFAKRVIVNHLKAIVVNYETNAAASAAAVSQRATSSSDISLT